MKSNYLIRKLVIGLYLTLSIILMSPLLLLFFLTTEKRIIVLDLKRWSKIYSINYSDLINLIILLSRYKEFRNLYYYRIKQGNLIAEILTHCFMLFYKELPTLIINSGNCGPGLFIQHGFSTIISANNIGENCWINQQVTIGYRDAINRPTIGNNVTITAGVKVIGGVNIGDNVTIGANAVVVKDIPPNCVVVGVPAYIIKRNGVKVKKPNNVLNYGT